MPRATGSFQILSGNEDSYEERDGGGKLAHAWGDQAFSGDISGDGNVHWLISYAAAAWSRAKETRQRISSGSSGSPDPLAGGLAPS
jgi:hypothetical protein